MDPEETLDPEELARRVVDACRRLRPLLPDLDPGDLVLILQSLLRPPSERRFLLRPLGDGGYVF